MKRNSGKNYLAMYRKHMVIAETYNNELESQSVNNLLEIEKNFFNL